MALRKGDSLAQALGWGNHRLLLRGTGRTGCELTPHDVEKNLEE